MHLSGPGAARLAGRAQKGGSSSARLAWRVTVQEASRCLREAALRRRVADGRWARGLAATWSAAGGRKPGMYLVTSLVRALARAHMPLVSATRSAAANGSSGAGRHAAPNAAWGCRPAKSIAPAALTQSARRRGPWAPRSVAALPRASGRLPRGPFAARLVAQECKIAP